MKSTPKRIRRKIAAKELTVNPKENLSQTVVPVPQPEPLKTNTTKSIANKRTDEGEGDKTNKNDKCDDIYNSTESDEENIKKKQKLNEAEEDTQMDEGDEPTKGDSRDGTKEKEDDGYDDEEEDDESDEREGEINIKLLEGFRNELTSLRQQLLAKDVMIFRMEKKFSEFEEREKRRKLKKKLLKEKTTKLKKVESRKERELAETPSTISKKGRHERRKVLREKLKEDISTPLKAKKLEQTSEDDNLESEDDLKEFKEEKINKEEMVKIQPVPKPIQLSISVKPKMFSGRQDENIRTWLYQYEQCMLINQVDKSMWTQLAGIHLTGGASTWFTSVYSLKDTSNVPWDSFKKKISTAYEPQEYSLVLRGKVQSLKQGNNIDTYVNEMRLLLAQINDMTETDKIENFINGLKSKTQGWVRYETILCGRSS